MKSDKKRIKNEKRSVHNVKQKNKQKRNCS